MKIVVLDGYNKNPGDLSWDPLIAMGETEIYDFTEDCDVLERIKDAPIVLTNKVKITREIMDKNPQLKYIGVTATGYDPVDCAAAKEKGIVVTNVPVYGTDSVGQHAISMLLEITNRVALHNESVHAGEWITSRDFCYWKAPLHELTDKTMVVIGYGRIGQTTGRIAKALGMNVIAVDQFHNPNVTDPYMELEEALPLADVISMHCVLNAENRGMINKDTIALMKPGVIFINCARGPLVNEPDLVEGLKSGKVGYACLDVISKEPMVEGSVLLDAPNCIITPHIAGCSVEGRERLLNVAMNNVKAFLDGKPENVVNA
ncbi:MAG: D-2-hydroxyacid dehydrogenase [Candidatus Heteroscillospira sp.]|jgi:glycerate dehydrogenase